MKLNPFKVDLLKDIFVFHEKNDFMFLKIYSVKSISSLNKIINLAKEKMVFFSDLYYCLNVHYDGKERTHLFSINARWNGNFYRMEDVESTFREIDSRLGDGINTVQNPYRDLYFLPFFGVDNFLIRVERNKIYLHDPSSKNILQMIAMFEVNLHNIQIFPNFFKLVDDLALKMGINVDINVMFKNENKQSYLDAFLTFAEKKAHSFNEILERLTKTNEFNVILKERQIQKRDVVELFIKRMDNGQRSYAALNALDFFTKYLVGEPVAKSVSTSKDNIAGVDPLEKSDVGGSNCPKDVSDNPQASLVPLSFGVVSDASFCAFQAIIKREGEDGKFLDSRNSIFDDGAQIFAIVHDLSVKGLYSLLKRYINKRHFRFFFVDPEELAEFTRNLGRPLENICETEALPGIVSGDAITSVQTG